MDLINQKILAELKINSRIGWSNLANIVGISRQSLCKRVERMEEQRIIKGYTVITSHNTSYDSPHIIQAFLKIRFGKGNDYFQLSKILPSYDNIVESWAVTGDWDTIILVTGESMENISEIREIIVRIGGIDEIETDVIMHCLHDNKKFY